MFAACYLYQCTNYSNKQISSEVRKKLVLSTYTTTKSTQWGNKSCINHHKQIGKLAYFRKQLNCAKGSAIVLIMKSKEIARRWLPLAPQVYNSVKHYNSIRNMYVNVRRRMLYSLEWLNFKSRGQEGFVRIKKWFWTLVLHRNRTQIPAILCLSSAYKSAYLGT